MKVEVIANEDGTYLCYNYKTFEMLSEEVAHCILDIITEAYNQGKRDKVAEFKAALEQFGDV